MGVMLAAVFIEPHERYEAIEAYGDKLTPEQIEEIKDAPESALIRLQFGGGPTRLTVIEEG